MWNQIKNNDDVADFMGKLAYFLDSCLKELKYVSGAYIEEHYMQPINKKRTLNIIIHCGVDQLEEEWLRG